MNKQKGIFNYFSTAVQVFLLSQPAFEQKFLDEKYLSSLIQRGAATDLSAFVTRLLAFLRQTFSDAIKLDPTFCIPTLRFIIYQTGERFAVLIPVLFESKAIEVSKVFPLSDILELRSTADNIEADLDTYKPFFLESEDFGMLRLRFSPKMGKISNIQAMDHETVEIMRKRFLPKVPVKSGFVKPAFKETEPLQSDPQYKASNTESPAMDQDQSASWSAQAQRWFNGSLGQFNFPSHQPPGRMTYHPELFPRALMNLMASMAGVGLLFDSRQHLRVIQQEKQTFPITTLVFTIFLNNQPPMQQRFGQAPNLAVSFLRTEHESKVFVLEFHNQHSVTASQPYDHFICPSVRYLDSDIYVAAMHAVTYLLKGTYPDIKLAASQQPMMY